jgi:hypothetical protein
VVNGRFVGILISNVNQLRLICELCGSAGVAVALRRISRSSNRGATAQQRRQRRQRRRRLAESGRVAERQVKAMAMDDGWSDRDQRSSSDLAIQ